MSSALLLSIGLGAGVGLLYSLASHATYRVAAGRGDRRFFQIVMGGAVVRLVAAVLLVVAILLLAAVDAAAFLGSFLIVFSAGLGREVWWMHRHPQASVER